MTNADKIRKMTNEELAEIIECPHGNSENLCNLEISCIECCKEWLESSAEEN